MSMAKFIVLKNRQKTCMTVSAEILKSASDEHFTFP